MKRSGIRSIGDLLGDFVRDSNLEEGLLETRVCEAWDALVIGSVVLGSHTSRRTFRDGVLTCRLRSSVVRAHLKPMSGMLCSELNRRLQGDYVKEIKLL